MVSMNELDLSEKVNVQMRLPRDVYERLIAESRRTMIPVTFLVRRCVLDCYGGDSILPSGDTNRTNSVQEVQ